MHPIGCVMFDFGNVVGIFDTPRFHSFIRENSQNHTEPRDLFFGPLTDVFKRYDLGEINDHKFFGFIQQAFQFRSNAIMDDLFYVFGDVLDIDREILRIRDELRRQGIVTALITNMNPFHAAYIRRKYPEIFNGFDYNFISCEEGIVKPNPEAWIRTLDHLGFKAEETIFIDDFIDNIEECCKLGIKGWHYNITGKYYYQNGKLNEERQKLKDFLSLLWNRGIMAPKLP
ncbi:MAG: hypothetical protein A3C61_02985 [Candidatus Yanofskybacteria bacterium RIFCSPHIGHO2_02_FULL_39_10]|uniref:Haloacid dehalogenase n=1 Tax=Candidatus Yanofskybacteria bacterium RIFCSPHIGHO2_02_FULL_39_10 TaxID=1802674 RepID=A0A1F8F9C2_9BACT|nr:MAG: hypothetical protein A3C61_02985 [Candidatus Yanofskybacteria bacterium RIFCSPHIGHO2_02_FULL_39_10]